MNDEATQPPNAARPPLDPMFPQLLKEADSPEQKLIGFIAFGLYEEARREWATDFRDREGRYPVENEFRAYEHTVVNQLEAEILRRALKGRFWRSVGRWLFSALIFTLILLGTLVAAGRAGIDPIRIMQDFTTPPRSSSSEPIQTPLLPSAPVPAQRAR